jgi:hypothetical protein
MTPRRRLRFTRDSLPPGRSTRPAPASRLARNLQRMGNAIVTEA